MFNNIKLKNTLSNLFMCQPEIGLLSEILTSLDKVKSRRTYMFIRESLFIDLEVEGL